MNNAPDTTLVQMSCQNSWKWIMGETSLNRESGWVLLKLSSVLLYGYK
jgi:hypothetical protein